jgi:hypothetical protein
MIVEFFLPNTFLDKNKGRGISVDFTSFSKCAIEFLFVDSVLIADFDLGVHCDYD